jgi:hypothetical protein
MLLLAAGCAAFEPGAERVIATDKIVAEALNASRAPLSEQKAVLARAQRAYAGQPTSLNRVRVAVLLATLPAPLRDDAKAVELLEPIAEPDSPGPGRLAALMLGQIGERQRGTRERQQADVEREAMRQQLEALRSIDRSNLEREEKMRNKKR